MNSSLRFILALSFLACIGLAGCSTDVDLPGLESPQAISVPDPVTDPEPEADPSVVPDDKDPAVAPSKPVEEQPAETPEVSAHDENQAAEEAEIARAEAYLAENPKDRKAAKIFGGALVEFGHYERAIAFYQDRLLKMPDDSEYQYGLGWAYEQSDQLSKAIESYELAIKSDDQNIAAINNLAWILATTPNDKIRDGERALTLSKQSIVVAGKRPSILLETLAAAFAETGQFQLAVEAQRLAITDAPADKQQGLRSRLKLYEQNKPYRSGAEEVSK